MTDYKGDHEFYARKQYKNEVFHSLGGTGTRVPSQKDRYHLLKTEKRLPRKMFFT